MFGNLRKTAVQESFDFESLIFRIERSRLRWVGQVSRMPQEWLPKQTLNAKVNELSPIGRPQTFNGLTISRILEPFWTLSKQNAVCVGSSKSVVA